VIRIGFLGAFSIDNAGDALVGYAGRQAIRALVPDAVHTIYAPAFPQPFWGHGWDHARGIDADVIAVPPDTDLAWAADLDALVIGGGGIINLDPAFRAFLLGDPAAWQDRCPAAWNGVCSQNQPWYAAAHAATYASVRGCCEALRYVGVRNRTTLTFVRRAGFTGEVHLVPDPALLLEVPPAIDAEVDAVLAGLGADRGRVLVGVSLGPSVEDPRTASFYASLFTTLAALAPALDLQFVVFPFSHLQGDAAVADAIAAQLPGALLVRDRLAPLVLWRLIGRLGFYLGCRYHAMLAAFSQQVPFLILDEYLRDAVASSKVREFVADVGLEPHYLCPYLPGSPAWKIEELIRARAQVAFAGRLAQLRAGLRGHYRQMLAALGLPITTAP
jgi:hypothetical protein